mgnify:CR=1 FL=1
MSDVPFALCHCGTPLVGTLEVRKTEWYCVTCEAFYEWMHARPGIGPNPTDDLAERYEAARKQYDAERRVRRESVEASALIGELTGGAE